MKYLFFCVVIFILAVSLVGCGAPEAPTPTSTSEPPTDTPVPEPPTATATTEPPTATPTPEPPTATPEPPTPTPVPEGVVNAEPSLNLRSGPATTFDILATMPTGTRVTILERNEDGTWVKITSEEFGEGWVAAEFLDMTTPSDVMPVATEEVGEPTSEIPPTAAADTPTPEPAQPTATLALPATPVPGGDIDAYISALLEGTHNDLGQPVALGSVPAGGKSELVIANDSPFALKIHLGNPAGTETSLDACQDCQVYEGAGPEECAPEKPHKTLRIDPGTLRLAIETSSPDIVPYVGEWTLEGNQRYSLCFYILREEAAP